MSDEFRCKLCGATDQLFVAEEAGTEDVSERPVAQGDVVCFRHTARTPSGGYVRIRGALTAAPQNPQDSPTR